MAFHCGFTPSHASARLMAWLRNCGANQRAIIAAGCLLLYNGPPR